MTKKLDSLRAEIDSVDDELLALLDQRARIVARATRAKRSARLPLHDPEREKQIFERLEKRLTGTRRAAFPVAALRPVFREILSACLSVESELTVTYFGPPGTYTHMAALREFGTAARLVEASTIPAVFDAVGTSASTYGVVPIENSTEGSVTYTLDSFLESTVSIRGEIVLDIAHCLVGRATDDVAKIERVYSHPQALAQCRDWLARNLPRAQLVVSLSTSTAARDAAADDGGAAISSRLAAELAGLRVIREGIQDRKENATRFVILAREDAPPSGDDRTSIVFSTRDQRGALRRVLEIFDDEKLNLSRIESRPRRGERWQYVFFTDLEGHRLDAGVTRALARLDTKCDMVRVLGSYPRDRGAPAR
ncbi:MAG: prephenate dehydratase [Deltaproteobacteria bacterium]|nr:prephenate dehydratase [Deltaproteobacteria bacterium]